MLARRIAVAAALAALVVVPSAPAQATPSATCTAVRSGDHVVVSGVAANKSYVFLKSNDPTQGTWAAPVAADGSFTGWVYVGLALPGETYTVGVYGQKTFTKALGSCSFTA